MDYCWRGELVKKGRRWMSMPFPARCSAGWCIRRQVRPASGSCSDVCRQSSEKRLRTTGVRRPVSLVWLPALGMQRPGMGRDGGWWRAQSMQGCTGPLQRMLRARPGGIQAQGRASKPCWPRGKGAHGDKPLQTFQDPLLAVLLELFLRCTEEEGNHDE